MAQPVRQAIKEAHPEIEMQEKTRTLIIDGGNLLRISFADDKINSNGVHYGGVFQFLLQIKMMLKKTSFDYVYCVFDNEDSGIYRFQLYNAYKANREKKYAEHSFLSQYGEQVESKLRMWREKYAKKTPKSQEKIDEEQIVHENFARERDILLKYFNELYIRWIFDEKTEGDDIIAYYVQHKRPNDLVYIMSSDEDLTQLISDTVCIWNPIKKKWYSKKNFQQEKGYPVENVMIKKIFCGDTSDNIGNIKGLSENRLFELMPEMHDRPVTVDEVINRAQSLIDERVASKKKPLEWHMNIVKGVSNKEYDGDFYEINEKIINLKKPMLSDDAKNEIISMMYAPQDPDGRSFQNLYQYIIDDGIDELMESNRFSSFFYEFKLFVDREIKKYEEYVKSVK